MHKKRGIDSVDCTCLFFSPKRLGRITEALRKNLTEPNLFTATKVVESENIVVPNRKIQLPKPFNECE